MKALNLSDIGGRSFELNRASARPAMFLPAAVGFFFSFRIFAVLLAVRVLGSDPQFGVILSLAVNFLLLVLVAFYSFGPPAKPLSALLRLPSYSWILFFLAFSGCSLAWSVTASLPAAAAFWGAMAADVMMVVLILRTGPVLEAAASIMKGYIYGACAIALVAWIMPAQSDLRLGDEQLLGPNAIGYACAFGVFLAEYLILVPKEDERREAGRWKWPAIFLAITLLRSLSKTSIIAFTAAHAVILFMNQSISRKMKIAIGFGLLAVVVVFWGLLSSYYDIYANGSDQAESFSGRFGIWAYILNEALDRPWFGHGFHSVWKVIPPFYIDRFEARHAHNELLQQFYAYGVMGIVMLVGLYGSFFLQVRKIVASPLRTMLLGLIICVLVRGIADTEVFDLSLPLWAIAMFSAIIAESADTVSLPAAV